MSSIGSIILKIGGGPAGDRATVQALSAELAALTGNGTAPSGVARSVAIVHGGGADVSSLSRRLGMRPVFIDGVRMTDNDEMDIVDMVLCGLVNKRLVRSLTSCGIPAIGISGADGTLLLGDPVIDAAGTRSRTAHVSEVNPEIISRLWSFGYLPVIASPGSDRDGGAVNINADEAAFAIGVAVGATTIVFLSDVPAVQGSDGDELASLGIEKANRLVHEGTITGGMVAKIRSSAGAISAGIAHIVVGSYEVSGDLSRLLSGHTGTTIHGEGEC